MSRKLIRVNRAPVLTLWAAIVAERLGYDRNTALTLGKAVAGLNAQSKGQRLGIFDKPKDRPLKSQRKSEKKKEQIVTLMGRAIPMTRSTAGQRATIKDETIDPKSVEKYLALKFGGDLNDVEDAMRSLAKAFSPEKLGTIAYSLYEKFRPTVPEGQKGWGVKGELDLNRFRSLAR